MRSCLYTVESRYVKLQRHYFYIDHLKNMESFSSLPCVESPVVKLQLLAWFYMQGIFSLTLYIIGLKLHVLLQYYHMVKIEFWLY